MLLVDPRLMILLVTMTVVVGLTWAVFLYAFSMVGFDSGLFELVLVTSVSLCGRHGDPGLAGILSQGSRRNQVGGVSEGVRSTAET